MNHRLPLTLVSIVAILGFSCHRNTNSEYSDIAHQLFMKSMYLTEQYIDSMENAIDSTSLLNIVANFNAKLTKLNYQFPPDTDLDLSEEENDSLIRMFKHLDAIVDKKLKKFAGILPGDSIEMVKDSAINLLSIPEKNHDSGDSHSFSEKQVAPPSHTENN